MYHILICDDEQDIVNALKIYLADPDFKLFEANTGLEALQVMEKHDIHLILMDIMMPRMDGISAMVKIREKSNVPVILLTAKGEDNDKILGLNAGADDYITKPFNPLEVVARVKAQLRRYTRYNSPVRSAAKVYDSRGLIVNYDTHECSLFGKPVFLTPIEFKILWLLCQNAGKVVSSEEIFEKVWGEEYLDSNNTVMVHIRRMREKLQEPSRKPRFIKTVWGVGYKIDE